MKWIFAPALAIAAALAFGCQVPFLASGPAPSGPPFAAEKTAPGEIKPASAKEKIVRQPLVCNGKECPQTAEARTTAAKPSRPAVIESRRDESSGVGPRLARL